MCHARIKVSDNTAVALDHIHKCGFTHNDLKCNNVVLEKREDQLLHPVIVDFGKSFAFTKAKIAVPKQSHLKGHYKNSYIALELVDGTGKPSIESDVYSLTYLINKVYGLLKFKTMPCIKKGLSEVATNRLYVPLFRLFFSSSLYVFYAVTFGEDYIQTFPANYCCLVSDIVYRKKISLKHYYLGYLN